MYEDKTLICPWCQREFVYSAGEQEYYHERGFKNEVKYCRDCRRHEHEMYEKMREHEASMLPPP
jgi:hypothetical protein